MVLVVSVRFWISWSAVSLLPTRVVALRLARAKARRPAKTGQAGSPQRQSWPPLKVSLPKSLGFGHSFSGTVWTSKKFSPKKTAAEAGPLDTPDLFDRHIETFHSLSGGADGGGHQDEGSPLKFNATMRNARHFGSSAFFDIPTWPVRMWGLYSECSVSFLVSAKTKNTATAEPKSWTIESNVHIEVLVRDFRWLEGNDPHVNDAHQRVANHTDMCQHR